MEQRNTYRNNNPEDHFDLDNYINEKSNPGVDSTPRSFDDEKKLSWFKNTLLVLGLAIFTILYFNNWSPTQVYGNIFGIEKYQDGYEIDPIIINNENLASGILDETTLAGLAKLEELEQLRELGSLENLEALEGISSIENLEGLQELERSFSNLENLEEMNELRTFALETAMEALANIGESEEFGEIIGGSVQLGIQEALRELENLREQEISGAGQVANNAINITSSFETYSSELEQIGVSEIFNSSDQQKLHQANIPSIFLEQLNELNLLEKLDTESIIEAYNGRG